MPFKRAPDPIASPTSGRNTNQARVRQGQRQFRQQLRRVLEQANCLVWQAEVNELFPVDHCPMVFDESRGTFLNWDIEVINQSEEEVPSWLPVAREQGETITQAWLRSRDPQDEVTAADVARSALWSRLPRYQQTFRNQMADGSIRWMQEDVSIEELSPPTRTRGRNRSAGRLHRWRLTGVVTDITDRKLAEEKQRSLASDLRQVTQRANCLLWRAEVYEEIPPQGWTAPLFDAEKGSKLTWDLSLVNEHEVLDWLPFERREGETITQAWYRSRHPEDMVDSDQHSWRCLSSGGDRYTLTYRNRMIDGSTRWMQEDVRVEELSPILLESDGKTTLRHWRLIGVVTDITQRKAAEEALWWRANRDSLTGIANRDWIRECVQQEIVDRRLSNPQRIEPRQGALFVLDLDGFKYVNDSLGHGIGDRVLQVIATRLENVVQRDVTRYGATPVCARLGGDEFVVWTPQIFPESLGRSGDDARAVVAHIAEHLLQAISLPTRLDVLDSVERELLMTTSIGIALSPDDGEDTETLFKNADTALYQAKEAGRGKYRFHTRERSNAIATRLALETRLRQAVRNEALTLWYQPQIDTVSRQIVGLEALLRWHDDALGHVPPNTFIPLAEEIGLIHALGEYALRMACRQATYWRDTLHPTLRMCVNLSALQLVEAGMVQIVLSALEEAGLPGDALELEITETALFRSGEKGSATFLRDVRARGVRLAIDDFGTGYSSLSYLRSLPVDVVKIDRNFIGDITTNHQTRSIVRAIIDLAHALGSTVTAEGVETEEQQAILADLHCNTIQGYLYSCPLAAHDMERLLENRARILPGS